MRVEVLVRMLEDLQKQFASATLSHPSGKESYDLGRAVGVYAGLAMAINLIMETIADEESGKFDL
jgi:hypothetical protein